MNLIECNIPSEMIHCKPGIYSIHYYGESEGTVRKWDGRLAVTLANDDQDEALLAGAIPEGETELQADIEVRVIVVGMDQEAWLMDQAIIS